MALCIWWHLAENANLYLKMSRQTDYRDALSLAPLITFFII